MDQTSLYSVQEYLNLRDFDLGFSTWTKIDQEQINNFAYITGDHQFIHTDAEKAAATPFGGTIVHGALLLSIIIPQSEDVVPEIEGCKMKVNMGFDKVRFITPVRAGSQVRTHFSISKVFERSPGALQTMITATMEIENTETPALVAQWIMLAYV